MPKTTEEIINMQEGNPSPYSWGVNNKKRWWSEEEIIDALIMTNKLRFCRDEDSLTEEKLRLIHWMDVANALKINHSEFHDAQKVKKDD